MPKNHDHKDTNRANEKVKGEPEKKTASKAVKKQNYIAQTSAPKVTKVECKYCGAKVENDAWEQHFANLGCNRT